MNEEIKVSSAEQDASQRAAPAERLRALLANPKADDAAWQNEAARAVSLLAVEFQKATDDVAAFVAIALIGRAAASGVKEAKKRVLRLNRWAESAPPTLDALSCAEEQRAAIATLSKVSMPWATAYVDSALSNAATPTALLHDLLRWARAVAPDWTTFVRGTVSVAIAHSADAVRTLTLVKDAQKLLRPNDLFTPRDDAESFGTLARAVVDAAGRCAEDEKAAVAILNAALGLIEQAWQQCPALLQQPALIGALQVLSEVIVKVKKSAPSSIDSAALAATSLLMDSIGRFGGEAVAQWRPLLPMWRAACPSFDDHLATATIKVPALAALAGASSSEPDATVTKFASEEAFATLLPAWDAFVAALPDRSSAASLTTMIRRAAGTVGIEALGTVGEELDFDPLAHHRADATASLTVRVLRPGVVVRRVDGSMRVLVQVFVESVNPT